MVENWDYDDVCFTTYNWAYTHVVCVCCKNNNCDDTHFNVVKVVLRLSPSTSESTLSILLLWRLRVGNSMSEQGGENTINLSWRLSSTFQPISIVLQNQHLMCWVVHDYVASISVKLLSVSNIKYLPWCCKCVSRNVIWLTPILSRFCWIWVLRPAYPNSRFDSSRDWGVEIKGKNKPKISSAWVIEFNIPICSTRIFRKLDTLVMLGMNIKIITCCLWWAWQLWVAVAIDVIQEMYNHLL